MPTPRTVRLAKRIEKSVASGHPWIWSDALERTEFVAGDLATVVDGQGAFVGRGIMDDGAIGVRIWSTKDVPVDGAFMAARFRAASLLRDRVLPPATTAYRLLHGEGDRTPGVVCDVYGEHGVVRFDGQGVVAWSEMIVAQLVPVLAARGVTNVHVREGKRGEATLRTVAGALPDAPFPVLEHGMTLEVDLIHGQKTGLFLDQREARKRVREIAKGSRVLNLYGYTGGFSVSAGLGGATHVTTVDTALEAVAGAERNWRSNGLAEGAHEGAAQDVPIFLDHTIRKRQSFDLVISDPPNFAPSESVVPGALESYRKLHGSALRVVVPGGLYLASSCSSHVRAEAFEGTLREAAERAGMIVQVLERWAAPADHPRLLAFPQGDYLKTLLCRVGE